MSKSLIGDHELAEMIEGQTFDSVLDAQAPAEEMHDVPLEGFEHHDGNNSSVASGSAEHKDGALRSPRRKAKKRPIPQPVKQRFGLPDGFVPRWQRFERSVLLELNIYRLPNGREFIPCHPSGTLSTHQHLYALLTSEQYLNKKRGSVYIRQDGRIFDYSVDSGNVAGDFFDTGYMIYDLERTGRYAPSPGRKKKKNEPAKYRRATATG